MATLEIKTTSDLLTLVQALSIAVQSQLLSREQAAGAVKDQLYGTGISKRPTVPPEKEEKKKT